MSDLYIIQMRVTGALKIGRSIDPVRRLKQIQTGCPHPCALILVVPGAGPREALLHRLLKPYQTQGEWFTVDALGALPHDVYGLIPVTLLDLINAEWWQAPGAPVPSFYAHKLKIIPASTEVVHP